MKKICFVITAEFVVRAFLINHLKALSVHYEITVLVNTNNPNFLSELGVDVELIPLKISRDIQPISDLSVLLKLIVLFMKKDFDAVHSVTPKAGLLAMLAAWVVRIPFRTHIFTGQVWANKIGLKRYSLKRFDWIIATLATHNIIDSPSQRNFLIQENVMVAEKSIVFGKGSISGVDTTKFKPNLLIRKKIRHQMNIKSNDILFLFLGRLTQDKGVLDLASAFNDIVGLHLLFVGPDEQNLQQKIRNLKVNSRQYLHFVGYTSEPEDYISAADVLCLPSYREGFGSVIIEAAAMGVPAIASRIYGVTDAVVENQTGLLHNPHDILELKNCITMMRDNAFRIKLGKQAKRRAISYFDSKLLTQCWVAFYRDKLG